jgi:penicillin-binding protein 1A
MTQCYEGNPGLIRPAAVKTGTSNDFRDNWTVGYTSDYVVGVWAGNNDNSAMINITGVDGAAPIWHDTLLLAEQGHPVVNFAPPGGVVKKTVNYGGLTSTDWYMVQAKK